MSRLSRDLWRVVEPFHQPAYRSPEAVAEYSKLGLSEGPQQYFAGRLAAMGPIGPKVAVAVLYGFAPDYVGSAVPAVWSVASTSDMSAARQRGASATLERVLGRAVLDSAEIAEASRIARGLVDALDFAGRPMAAAHAQLPWPGTAALDLWHCCTIIREHRGDAHWAATSGEGIDAVECHVLHAADGAMPAELLRRVTGWSDAHWRTAIERLRSRGLVRGEGGDAVVTTDGAATKLRIERATDAAIMAAVDAVGRPAVERLRALMQPFTKQIMDAGVIGAWKVREELWKDLPES